MASPDLQPERFSHFANWLVRGRLLVGRYPHMSPAYCTSPQAGERQLASILRDAKVTTFVCLQGELPPQDVPASWPARGVSVAGFPGRFECYAERAAELAGSATKPSFVHAPMPDLGVPSPQQLAGLLDCLSERLRAGERVYLHCWGGRGRTGVVAACLLGHLFPELGAEGALDAVQTGYSARGDPLDSGALSRSPQTEEQRRFVRRWLSVDRRG